MGEPSYEIVYFGYARDGAIYKVEALRELVGTTSNSFRTLLTQVLKRRHFTDLRARVNSCPSTVVSMNLGDVHGHVLELP
jgi:hypothetical protein